MNSPVSIRRLGASDAHAMRAMLALFGDAFDDNDTYVAHMPDDAYLVRLLSSEGFVAMTAYSEEAIVGGLAGYLLPKFEQARSEFYIYDLAVDQAHRRRGVATAMIRNPRRLLVQQRVHVIFVQADHGDDAALALYTNLGTRGDVMHFDILPSNGGTAPGAEFAELV